MITFQSGDITDVRLGSTAITSICVGAVEVWSAKPAGVLWVHELIDQRYAPFDNPAFTTGWTDNVVPNWSKYPAPAKGSVLLNGWVDMYDRFCVAVIIFNGTKWVIDPKELAIDFHMPAAATPTEYIYCHWWNIPGPTDVQDFLDVQDPGKLQLSAWAAADGIHMRLTSKDDKTAEFTKPYPAGITATDLPPTNSDVFTP
jgi:hypothetical protein